MKSLATSTCSHIIIAFITFFSHLIQRNVISLADEVLFTEELASLCTWPVNVFTVPVVIVTNELFKKSDTCSLMSISETRSGPNNNKYFPRQPSVPSTTAPPLMPSLARYIRGIRAVGLKEWWRQMQYIGDVKVGTLVGSDQCVSCFSPPSSRDQFRVYALVIRQVRKPLFRKSQPRAGGPRCVCPYCCVPHAIPRKTNRLGRHRWVDFAQVSRRPALGAWLGAQSLIELLFP